MPSPGDLCSHQLYTVELCRDTKIRTGKSSWTKRSSGVDILPCSIPRDFVTWGYLNHWWRPWWSDIRTGVRFLQPDERMESAPIALPKPFSVCQKRLFRSRTPLCTDGRTHWRASARRLSWGGEGHFTSLVALPLTAPIVANIQNPMVISVPFLNVRVFQLSCQSGFVGL
jgi:hypothetical protein